jgi:trehalose synthase-fused probable maltokinase
VTDRPAVVAAVAALDPAALAEARWFGAKGRRVVDRQLDQAFVLGGPGSSAHVLAIVTLTLDNGTRQRYSVPLAGDPLRPADPGDGVWRELARSMAAGRVIPALSDDPSASPTAVLVCRPAVAMPAAGPGVERDLGADQSNTSVVLGADDEAILLKAYRRLHEGLNPDLEMTAFLTEEAGFSAVPPLAGFVELVEAGRGTTTVAMAQAYIADGADAYESIVEMLVGWLLAPGEVSLEYATEVAADLGTLTAGLHAALSDGRGLPEMAPRAASRDELRAWVAAGQEHLDQAVEATMADPGATAVLRELAPRIQESLTILEAMPRTPEVIRAHGDYHLGQILISPDGYRIIDFEGEPLGPLAERRAHRHPLRDVASMLRSLDHAGRSAGRRAEERQGGPIQQPGLDLAGWLQRSRQRFLESYRAGMLEARVVPDLDPDLVLAFETDKELYEFVYAATYLPSWLWAPTEGMRALYDGSLS